MFRNFQPVIEKAKEACVKSGHIVADHFAEIRNMVDIGPDALRGLEDWELSRYASSLPRFGLKWQQKCHLGSRVRNAFDLEFAAQLLAALAHV